MKQLILKIKKAEVNMGIVISAVIAVSTGILLFTAFREVITNTVIPALIQSIKSLFQKV